MIDVDVQYKENCMNHLWDMVGHKFGNEKTIYGFLQTSKNTGILKWIHVVCIRSNYAIPLSPSDAETLVTLCYKSFNFNSQKKNIYIK